MKVKNIMFSGVMGVILMSVASSANAAIQVASKAYVDTKASNVETAYKAADSALETAYKAADSALDAKISTNTQEIEAVKVLTGETNVAKQIENALKVETGAREAAVKTLEDADKALENAYKAADEALAGDIADMDTAYKAADTALDGKISANAAAITAEAEARANADSALEDAYKAADAGLQGAIDDINDSDVMKSGIDATKVSVLDGFITNNCSAQSELCVLSKDNTGNYAWTDVTAPLDDQQAE